MLFADRTFDTGGGVANSLLPNTISSGSVLNVDGLLGLSYWFDSAAKLTVGYRADYFKTLADLQHHRHRGGQRQSTTGR